jgi:signal transduction histidine kinase
MVFGGGTGDAQSQRRARWRAMAAPWMRGLDLTSHERVFESILRRIIRIACLFGVVGITLSLTSESYYDPIAQGFSGVSTLIAFGATFLPIQARVLSLMFPTMLAATGIVLAVLLGPSVDAFLCLAGGLFVGALVLPTHLFAALSAVSWVGIFAVALRAPIAEHSKEVWQSALATMVAVVIPTTIAGRVLVAALVRALRERQGLVDDVVAEREALQATVRDLESTRIQLTHAQKLELMSQLAGGIAHDMNNALTAIIGEASLLDDSKSEERERILEAGEYAAKLTHQLMLFARRDTSQPKPLDIVAAVNGMLRSVRRLVPSDVSLETDLPNETIVVVADATQLLQVLLNLATNAKDAMPRGGALKVALYRDVHAQQAVLCVTDTGTGIAADHVSRIFDPFFTTKPAGRGTGLGLANVKHLVTGMGGAIHVETQAGKGTTFELRLPLAEAEVVVASESTGARARRCATVLVVDDDVRVRAVAFTALQKAGHRVFEAPSISAALELARLHRRTVDLLLTDVVMEGGGGAEVIRSVQHIIPDVRVLVMSGYADDETLRRGIEQGQFPFIAKPFTSDALASAVDKALC